MRYRHLRFPEGRPKALTLSYDDGCPEDVRFSGILNKYGIKCTFNLNSDKIRHGRLPKDVIEEHILKHGHEIAIHGAEHKASGLIPAAEGIRDVLDCRLELEARFGRIIRGMAYPDSGITRFENGATYASIKQYLTDLNVAYARTLGGDNDSFLLPIDWHAWMPTAHHTNPRIDEYIDSFLSLDFSEKTPVKHRMPRLFYLWGHSYEFERQNNWEHIEHICERLSGKDDIWYATNIEIYEYVNAYHSLIFSADTTLVYNPTLYKIWFDADGVLYSISPGQTLTIQ